MNCPSVKSSLRWIEPKQLVFSQIFRWMYIVNECERKNVVWLRQAYTIALPHTTYLIQTTRWVFVLFMYSKRLGLEQV